jgi:8-hydroxy-5-deazaflavin:NADPH oxidoreductase
MPHEVTDERSHRTVGVVGFGKAGTVLARLARTAGYRVLAAGSSDPAGIAMTAEVLTPGVRTGWATEVIDAADIVILAIPLRAHRDLPAARLAGKIVVDAVNHWHEIDGPRENWLRPEESSSEHLRSVLPGARLVKGFNHLGYHDLDERARPRRAPDRVAIALASDDDEAAARVADLVDAMGFDPVRIGPLRAGRALEPGGPVFGAVLSAGTLETLLAEATEPPASA